MYEHRKQKLAPMAVFYQRVARNVFLSLAIMLVCLLIGIAGYHYTAGIAWIDSLHNASMILSGMGLWSRSLLPEASGSRRYMHYSVVLFLLPTLALYWRLLCIAFITGCILPINHPDPYA